MRQRIKTTTLEEPRKKEKESERERWREREREQRERKRKRERERERERECVWEKERVSEKTYTKQTSTVTAIPRRWIRSSLWLFNTGNNDLFLVSVFDLEASKRPKKNQWKLLVLFEKNVLRKKIALKEGIGLIISAIGCHVLTTVSMKF